MSLVTSTPTVHVETIDSPALLTRISFWRSLTLSCASRGESQTESWLIMETKNQSHGAGRITFNLICLLAAAVAQAADGPPGNPGDRPPAGNALPGGPGGPGGFPPGGGGRGMGPM